MKAISVFCGSNFDGNPVLLKAVNDLADAMVEKEISLVFGGGRVGVMGLIADAVLKRGGKAIGVIPQFLMDKEVGHTGLTELIITENMHQRKQKMADLSDGVITMPGGFGTMEEFFEVLTWLQLGIHGNPIGLLNVDGFYDPLLLQIDLMVEKKFLKPLNRELVLSDHDPKTLIERMEKFDSKPDEVWFRDRNLT
ncbi:MAG: Rossman fold protein, TIGR00730 family [Sphingobacteriales bacterium 17-39-43]|uniref:LOG family protein n=1 Tax=Daejeonella sp. TaxID=2805397 RepID=UPI000BC8DB5B|nr:TIGR00730 family Rossman fold protein [Daejeonella sp.]OYY02589.1 MAG: Rossman fold protein, TIGR00730 family [Sphingobacteriia bacterium 35-40-5]OYZ28027.1 MAG: Rossman fold protein, TIGR00730 family [Sphingobacteriales bacterium 16-39-50]OYZ55119.1 MAG: Rossman fold protein, TIGR00730 family [Sphingobacteriales bacterium 24-40-4]OZA21994.1 MAG: Rossman fold protein, TIGR00730 family [Sphingobacteriales bacterium 17-39-43]HQS05143.1 TIGR00730 family Rossman fold protein [Daejeonella sp.]